MKRSASILAALVSVLGPAGPALAQEAAVLTADQKGYIVYDRCMMSAAIAASRTEAKDEEIFGLAKSSCAATRAAVTKGLEGNKDYIAALDAADADKATNFPGWIKGVRARRNALDIGSAGPAAPAGQ